MDNLLKPVSTAYRTPSPKDEEVHLVEVIGSSRHTDDTLKVKEVVETPKTPEEALNTLKSQPSFATLEIVLEFISHSVSFTLPSPIGSRLINTLLVDIVPHYWAILSEKHDGKQKYLHEISRANLLKIFRNASGLGAIVTRLKSLLEERKSKQSKTSTATTELLKDCLDLLSALIQGDTVLEDLSTDLSSFGTVQEQRTIWREITTLLAGGRLVGTAAEAFNFVKEDSKEILDDPWLADSLKVGRWIGKNLYFWALHLAGTKDDTKQWESLLDIMRKGLRLGHPDVIQEELLKLCILNEAALSSMLASMTSSDKKLFTSGALRCLSRWYLSSSIDHENSEWWKKDGKMVAAAASFFQVLSVQDDTCKSTMLTWLTQTSGAGIGEPVGIRRAVVAAFASSKHDLESVLDKSMQMFGDQLYIKHTPSMQQDVHAQIVLLVASYVHRSSPLKLKMLTRSSTYLNAVSNRLASSSDRAKFLGMIVGEALSALADAPGKHMDFKMEELQTAEAKWYKSLVKVQDSLGPVADLRNFTAPQPQSAIGSVPSSSQNEKLRKPIKSTKPANTGSRIISIEEISGDDEDEDDDLVPYEKPDSDAEDSDDDPTLVTRNKPTAPVYIRDLLSYLRDTENYDRQKLALSSASALIRRKANFGSEVKDHTEELASLLIGLQDKFNIENFTGLRNRSMIAVLLADPSRMAPWFAKTFFDGDYSVSQRASVLSTVTMAARELGGFAEEDKSSTNAPSPGGEHFPSKRLPGRLHDVYSPEPNAVDALTEKMSRAMIQPLAADLADQATGPNVLKVRTFSSRLAVESRRKAPTTNHLSTIAANSFFYPLTGRFFAHLKAYGGRNVLFESYLLSSLVKTLSLILHASGKNTLQLPQMTREYWDLLLSLRNHTVGDKAVSEAVLFGFMTILEINDDKRRLAEQHGREMLETQKWVEALFTTIGEGGSEEDKLKALAAGVLFRLREVVEKYQALLMGDLASF